MTRSHIIEAVVLFLLLCGTVGFLLHWYVDSATNWPLVGRQWRADRDERARDWWVEHSRRNARLLDAATPFYAEASADERAEIATKLWEAMDADDAADQLIAEWHAPDPDGLTAEDWIARDLADLELLAWDARVQAARCWEIVHVEFPRLRAELCAA